MSAEEIELQAALVEKLPVQAAQIYRLVLEAQRNFFDGQGNISIVPLMGDLSNVDISLFQEGVDRKGGQDYENVSAKIATLIVNSTANTVTVLARPARSLGYLAAETITIDQDLTNVKRLLEIGLGIRPREEKSVANN